MRPRRYSDLKGTVFFAIFIIGMIVIMGITNLKYKNQK